jgi:hypothetical protein
MRPNELVQILRKDIEMTINNNVGRADGLIRTDDILAALVRVTADIVARRRHRENRYGHI